jgi:hypothetical protein
VSDEIDILSSSFHLDQPPLVSYYEIERAEPSSCEGYIGEHIEYGDPSQYSPRRSHEGSTREHRDPSELSYCSGRDISRREDPSRNHRDHQGHTAQSSSHEHREHREHSEHISSRQHREHRDHSEHTSRREHREHRRTSQSPEHRAFHDNRASPSSISADKERLPLTRMLSIVNAASGCSLKFKLKANAPFAPALEAFRKKYQVKHPGEEVCFKFRKEYVHKHTTPAFLQMQDQDEISAHAVESKVQFCAFAFRGDRCTHQVCRFAHDASELDFEKRGVVFKRYLCKFGDCTLGAMCLDAHGWEERRSELVLPAGPVLKYFRDVGSLIFIFFDVRCVY